MGKTKNSKDFIKIRGAREHNLKNIDLDIPKNKLVVFTGVSGSGKSSLAYDTIYAEGQRRYVESLSTYARQFLGIMEKPEVDLIEGLSPAISIDQKTTSRNPRSTVGTVTEIYDYLRLLFARIGHPHCPECGREISTQSVDQVIDGILELIEDRLKSRKPLRLMMLSPIVRDKKGEFSSLFDNLKAKGFKQVRIDNHIKPLSEEFVLIKTNKHSIDAVVDKLSVSKKNFKDKLYRKNLRSRIGESVESSLKLSDGLVMVSEIKDKSFEMPDTPKKFEDHLFSENFACPVDNINLPELEPRTFSFNSPHGACKECGGIGKILKVEPELVFSEELSITEGGILPFKNMFENDTWYSRLVATVCKEESIDIKAPIKSYSDEQKKLILEGTGDKTYQVHGTNRFGKETSIQEEFPGIIDELEDRHANTESDWVRKEIEGYMRENTCPVCNGARLKKQALSVTINGFNIDEVTKLSIQEGLEYISDLRKESVLSKRERSIGKMIINEVESRLEFLNSVGLEYLKLNQSAGTLSGGEAQRIRLASQIGSGLTGVLYVLDEPTIGLHAKDNHKLINTLKRLRDIGNSILVVEHDGEMIRQADEIIDFGPHAGKKGGEAIAQGKLKDIKKSKKSITAEFLTGKKKIKIIPKQEGLEKKKSEKLIITGASENNLKDIKIEFPLRELVVITGVSGSGKSSLLVDTIYHGLKREFNPHYKESVGDHKKLDGVENVDKVILIDQSPIGRTPRSNPATYTKVFNHIRETFARTKEAKAAGFKKGRFSFNVKGGRCEACDGQGKNKIEMQFMSDIWIKCEVCDGKRYNKQTLDIKYRGKNISEVLDLNVAEAIEFFHSNPKIIKKLKTLQAVGLDYMELGQPATELSGGEAQRVKLATELSKRATGNTLYILDEPTTGLHFYDLKKLLKVLRLLVDKGNSVFLIEHNMDVIKNADWIIDLGPDGGDKGGKVVGTGKVDDIINNKDSYTGKYLKKYLKR